MHKQNFDTESDINYPLTIDRMAEAQGDWLAAQKILAAMLPEGNCIVCGCESAGSAGWVRMANEDGQPELFEVRSGSTDAAYLVLATANPTADNSDGASVVVRRERWLKWSANAGTTGCAFADLPRLRLRTTPQDDAEWVEASDGSNWRPNGDTGHRLRVQRVDGRVHLWGKMKYGLLVNGAWTFAYKTYNTDINNLRFASGDSLRLPEGYRPQGDMPVAIRYNDVATTAVLSSLGYLLLGRDVETEDTLTIDTWIDL